MKHSIRLWQALGLAFTALFGTLLHFLYQWLNDGAWIAPFASVNESTWEHMKLLFWPMLLFALLQRLFFRERADFWWIKLRGILLGLVLIPMLFYTYNGAIGPSPAWINIAIFLLAAAAAFLYETRQFREDDTPWGSQRTALAALIAIALLFGVFTFSPPRLGLFLDPLTGSFGR